MVIIFVSFCCFSKPDLMNPGMVLVLYVNCMRGLWRMRKYRKHAYLLMTHSTIVFILNTLFCASADRVLELTFVDNDDFPGGPLAWLNLESYIPVDVLGTITFCIVNWLLDALMVCYSILYLLKLYIILSSFSFGGV